MNCARCGNCAASLSKKTKPKIINKNKREVIDILDGRKQEKKERKKKQKTYTINKKKKQKKKKKPPPLQADNFLQFFYFQLQSPKKCK